MGTALALILSFALVFGIIFISELLVKFFHLPKEESRKFVHIGVSHWWILAMFTLDSWKLAIIPPIVFILLNLVSWYSNLFDAMERKTRDFSNLGTVYFPVALLGMVLLTWYDSPFIADVHPYLGALGIMAMGYGDGFAALIGSSRGKIKYSILGSHRTLEGSITMLIAALIPLFIIILISTPMGWLSALGIAAALAVLAAVVEAVTPWGLDNITVPFIVTLAGLFLL